MVSTAIYGLEVKVPSHQEGRSCWFAIQVRLGPVRKGNITKIVLVSLSLTSLATKTKAKGRDEGGISFA